MQKFVIPVTNVKTVICFFVGMGGRMFSARVNGLNTSGKSKHSLRIHILLQINKTSETYTLFS